MTPIGHDEKNCVTTPVGVRRWPRQAVSQGQNGPWSIGEGFLVRFPVVRVRWGGTGLLRLCVCPRARNGIAGPGPDTR